MSKRFSTTAAGIRAGEITKNGRLYSQAVLKTMADETRQRIREGHVMVHEGEEKPPSLARAIGVVRQVELAELFGHLVISVELLDLPDGQKNPLRKPINHTRIYCSMVGKSEFRNGVEVITEATLEYLYIPEEEG